MPAIQKKEGERRRNVRLRVQMPTDLGDLLDLSAGGARVRPRSVIPLRRGQKFWFNIQGLDDLIRVAVRVVWLKRKGWFGCLGREVGLEFVSLDAETRAALAALARTVTWNGRYEVKGAV
jgi:hypothetical protein